MYSQASSSGVLRQKQRFVEVCYCLFFNIRGRPLHYSAIIMISMWFHFISALKVRHDLLSYHVVDRRGMVWYSGLAWRGLFQPAFLIHRHKSDGDDMM